MLALDLFNTKYEKSLQEGAVDNLEAHRIDILNDRMDDLIHRASVPNNKEAREALMNEYNKVKAERDSYYKVNTSKTTNEMGYGSVVGENDQIPVGRMQPGTPEYVAARNRSVKYAELTPDYTGGHKTAGPTTVGYKKATNKPLVPGEVEVAEAGPRPEDVPAYLRKQQGQQPLTPGQVKAPRPGTLSDPRNLEKARGEENALEDVNEGFGPVGSKGLMNGNFATFMKARQNRTPVTLEIGGEEFRLTPTMMDAMAKKYLADKAASDAAPTNRDIKLIAINNYRAFGYPQLMRAFIDGVATHDNTPPANVPGEQLPMFERTQKVQKKNSKKDDPDLGAGTARDATVQRELQKVRARHPNARSDIEALVKDEIVNQERVDQELSQQQDNIQQQTAQLAQLGSVNQQQDTKINSLQQQLATAVQSIKSTPVAPATTKPPATPISKPAGVAPVTTPVPSSIAATLPVPQTAKDQEIYDKVQSLEKELKDKINAMASWNAIAQKDPQSNNELTALRKEVERTKKELQQQIIKLKPIEKKPTTQAPALSDPNVFDIDAWEVPGMAVPEVPDSIKTEPGTATPAKELPIDQLDHQVDTTPFAGGNKNTQWGPKNMRGGRFSVQDVDPYEVGVHSKTLESIEPGEEMTTNELLYRAAVEYMQHMGREGQPVDYETAIKLAAKHYHIPYRPGMVPELQNKRDELDAKLAAAIGAKRAERGARKQRQLARTAPTTPEQEKKMQDYWSKNAPQATRVKAPTRSLEEDQQLHVGDPIVVTAPNEFEGKTGEIYDFAPSGKFVIVNLYNHGKHSMHLSDVEYNQYADNEDEKEFWNGDKEVNESNMKRMLDDLKDTTDAEFEHLYGRPKFYWRKQLAGTPVKLIPQQDTPVTETKIHGKTPFELGGADAYYGRNFIHQVKSYGFKPGTEDFKEYVAGFHSEEGRKDYGHEPHHKPEPDPGERISEARDGDVNFGRGVTRDPWFVYAKQNPNNYKKFKTRDGAKAYAEKHGLSYASANYFYDHVQNKQGVAEGHADQQRRVFKKNGKPVGEVGIDRESSPGAGQWYMKCYARNIDLAGYDSYEEAVEELKHCLKQGVAEATPRHFGPKGAGTELARQIRANGELDRNKQPKPTGIPKKNEFNITEPKAKIQVKKDKGVAEGYTPDTNYSYTVVGNGKESQAYDSKEAARDAVRKLGAGYKIKRKPRTSARSVKKHFSNRNIDEESSTSSEAVEIALIRRVLVAHTDLIMNFGLDKVTQAIEEVAYNVGDVDEIGTSDVSGWIHQVKQILGVE